jgi:small acid-soluble spore protein F (minor alpha/beta-type SASP)
MNVLCGCFFLFMVHTTFVSQKEENRMAKKRGIMSEGLKVEIAKELGFYDVVEREGWGGIKSRDAGNMVKRAIEMAERGVAQKK